MVSDGAAAARTATRYVALDSLRGVAALGVVLFHLGDVGSLAKLDFVKSGWILVDFFFVLSGFVIAASYGERLAGGFSRARFMALRLGRIYPLHFVVLMAFLLAEVAIFRPLLGMPHPWGEFWRGLFLFDAFRQHTGNFFAPVSWSVAVEMVLYLIAALLFGRGRVGIAAAGLLVCAAAAAIVLRYNEPWFPALLQRGLLGFGLGATALAIHRRLPMPPRRWCNAMEIAAVAAVAAMLQAGPLGIHIPYAGLLFMAVTVIFAHEGGAVSRALHARPAVLLGLWSYSIYMTHLAVVVAFNTGLPRLFAALGHDEWVNRTGSTWFGLGAIRLGEASENAVLALLLAIVIALSALTWRHVEEPARQWSRRVVARRAAPVTAHEANAISPASFQTQAAGLTAEA